MDKTMSFVKKKPRTPTKSPHDYHNNNYGHTEVKMKNIFCVFCKKVFAIRDPHRTYYKSVMPLTRSCGHAICDYCSRLKANEACPICNDTQPSAGEGQMSLPMLNVYVMGLLNINRSRTNHTEDPKLIFEKSLRAKVQESTVVKPCVECGDMADVKCIPCKSNTYCKKCFITVHQYKTNKDHAMTPLNQDLANLVNLPIFCDEHKDIKLTHWCDDCEEPCCVDCIIEIHRHPNIIKLKEKNKQLLEKFKEAYNNLQETLLYTKDSRKRVAEALKVPQQAENIASVEAEINQHFLHLHGVLQNIEGKMITTLRAHRNRDERTLEEIEKKLEGTEKDLEAGFFVATAVRNHFENVNLDDVIKKLSDLAESSCCFVQKPIEHSENIRFHSKLLDIIPHLENHCKLEVVPTPKTVDLLAQKSLNIDNLPDITSQISTMPDLFANINFSQSSSSLASSSASTHSSETEAIRKPSAPIPLLLDTSNKKKYIDVAVYVTYIESPSNFYIRYASNNVLWKTVQEKLKFYDFDSVSPDEIKLRQVYVVKSNDNDNWLRASVIGVETDHEKNVKTYDVQFIDIGSHEKGVLQENIKELDESLLDIPPLAENHSLRDLYPRNKKTWDSEACEAMLDVVRSAENMTLTMRKMGEISHEVDILCPNKNKLYSHSLRDHLIFLELASWMTHERLYKMNPQSTAILHKDGFELNKYNQVLLTEAFDIDATPNNMYVRKASYTESTFKKLMDDMQEDYDRTKHTRGKIYTPDIGLICASRSTTNKWYRAVIVGTPGQQNVEAFYVDYGITDTIKYDWLRQLDIIYMKAATRAIKISLRDVAPVNGVWSPNAMLQLRDWMKNSVKLVAYEKIDDCYSVALIDNLTNENLNTRLVKMGFAESIGPVSRQAIPRRIPEYIHSPDSCDSPKPKQKRQKNKRRKSKKPSNSSSDLETTPTKDNIKQNLPKMRDIKENDPWKVAVIPLRIISPDEIYVSPLDTNEKYADMDKKLQKAYHFYKTSKDCEWAVGHVCVIHLKSSNVYRRAEIMEIKSPEQVSIYLCDVGDTLIVPLKDLQPLFMNFNDPANVFKIKLGGIYPPGGSPTWPTASCDKLREIVEANINSRFFIEKVIESDESPMIVDFFVEETKVFGALDPAIRQINAINRKLVEEGLALPIRNYNDTKIKILGADVEKGFDIGDKNPVVLEDDSEDSEDKDMNDSDDSGTIRDSDSESSDIPTTEPIHHCCKVFPENSPSWPPAEPVLYDEFIGMGVFLDWEAFLYINTPENAIKLEMINEELQKVYVYDEDVTTINDWKIGDLCIAQMHRLNTWHRAQVVGRQDNHLVICFVDYGNIEWASVSSIRKKLMFEDVPILVHKCQIKGMKPANHTKIWINNDLDKIHHMLVQRKWRIEVVKVLPEHLVINVTHPTPPHENVLKIMRSIYCIQVTDCKSSSSEADETDDNDVIIEYVSDMNRATNNKESLSTEILLSQIDLDAQYMSESPESCLSYDEMLSAHKENIIVRMFDNCEDYPSMSIPDNVQMFHGALGEVSQERANVVWVHATATEGCEYLTTLSKRYRKVMEDMKAEALDQPKLTEFEEGTPCCAVYDVDHRWYRCRIMSTMDNGEDMFVLVNFVDWGNSQWVSHSDLRVPKTEWLKLPAMAIKCYLHGIRVAGDNSAVRDLLNKFGTLRNQPLSITVEGREGDILSAHLFVDEECTMLLYQFLLDKGMFKKDVRKVLEKEFV